MVGNSQSVENELRNLGKYEHELVFSRETSKGHEGLFFSDGKVKRG